MTLASAAVRNHLKNFELERLFVEELGWDRHTSRLNVLVDADTYQLSAIAEKRGVQILKCEANHDGQIPSYKIRQKIEKQVTKSAYEHLIIYVDANRSSQIWQWVARQPGQPAAYREHAYHPQLQSGDALIQKLQAITIPLDEEESLDLTGTVHRLRDAFDRDRVTKRFYDHFKREHGAFLEFVNGIREQGDKEWYASLMLNRLMFVYFIQKKRFLDGDVDYLQNRLRQVQVRQGRGRFLSFYKYFLLCLFHEGFSKQPEQRELDEDLRALIGKVPYLNGGLFDVHELEIKYPRIDVPDEAFERLFAFFDQYEWLLDTRPLCNDREINPDVLGYIFEKYINQKQMGAYYTKEDITDYISKNTIIPFLFDAAKNKCAVAFEPGSAVWRLLQEDPDRYLYDAIRKGVIDDERREIQLPEEISVGIEDVSRRGRWNNPAAAEFALPTETWREHVARRQQCLEIRNKLLAGEVNDINDLITLNLNIRQFAEDLIVTCEGPELLRAMYQAIARVTVLDPTCGSGAFLFAALNILYALYDACLDRMQAFVDDLERSGEPHSPRKFEDFRKILADVERHPNHAYFILKSVIVNNLYGVDIMEEAVEICKLRMFLKLVSQIEPRPSVANYGVEPLPDIDFNIRPGNTLVGFATLDDVKKALAGTLGFDQDEVDVIVEEAEIVERAFQTFHEMQTEHGVDARSFVAQKQELRNRLVVLNEKLDRFLAGRFGIDAEKPRKFSRWQTSHEPFHWFAEFYGIMRTGGFDVIIGNPPYKELREVVEYSWRGYSCEAAGNLYALVLERCDGLTTTFGRQGYIVPVSSVSTDRYKQLQDLLSTHDLWFSSFDDRPSRLFDGLQHIRLTVHIIGQRSSDPTLHSSRYNKWYAEERSDLFKLLTLVPSSTTIVENALPKLSHSYERHILASLVSQGTSLNEFYVRQGGHSIYYSRKVGYFLQALDFEPTVLDGDGRLRPPSEFKVLRFSREDFARLSLCCLNSSLFYWFITVFSDCRHVNKREVDAFPIDLNALADSNAGQHLLPLSIRLMEDIRANSVERVMQFAHDTLTVQCIMPKYSKPILDELDEHLGNYFGFSIAEVDFLRSYDIKYRLGANSEDDE